MREYDELIELVRKGIMPKHEELFVEEDGRSIAHYVATCNFLSKKLPKTDEVFSIATREGWTVAHELACFKNLPVNFKLWGLTDIDGWTVAHVAAEKETLPKGFKDWNMCNKYQESIFLTSVINDHYVLPKKLEKAILEVNKNLDFVNKSIIDSFNFSSLHKVFIDLYTKIMDLKEEDYRATSKKYSGYFIDQCEEVFTKGDNLLREHVPNFSNYTDRIQHISREIKNKECKLLEKELSHEVDFSSTL